MLKKVLSFFSLFKKWVSLPSRFDVFSEKISKDIQTLKLDYKEIRESLIARGIIKPFTQSNSLKQITKRGYDLLSDYNVDSYLLKSNCELLSDETLKNKSDIEIYIKCLEWVKTKGREKVIEVILNSNLIEDQFNELLSLAIMEKIKLNKKKGDKI